MFCIHTSLESEHSVAIQHSGIIHHGHRQISNKYPTLRHNRALHFIEKSAYIQLYDTLLDQNKRKPADIRIPTLLNSVINVKK